MDDNTKKQLQLSFQNPPFKNELFRKAGQFHLPWLKIFDETYPGLQGFSVMKQRVWKLLKGILQQQGNLHHQMTEGLPWKWGK